jgi:transposase
MAHPPAPALIVQDADRGALQAAVRARTSAQRAVTRARIVLRSAEGTPIERIAAELGVAIMTVKLWRRRYTAAGLAGLADAPRPGHPPTYTRAGRDRLVALTVGPPPEGTTHWSVRAMARRTGMSPSTVHRIWAELGYKPHRTETFKFSTDPDLAAKVRDGVGLYLDPPDGAVVLCVDEKTGDPGARPHPAAAPDAPRTGRAPHARLHPPRHDLPVRGARGRHGCRHHDHPRTAHWGRMAAHAARVRLDRVTDLAEDLRDLSAQEDQGDDRDDRDQGEDQGIFGQTLAVVVRTK